MHPIEYNLTLTQAMLAEMEPYLLSEEVFWPLSSQAPAGQPQFPRLTLGGFLLTQDELTAQKMDMTPQQANSFRQLLAKFQSIRSKWKAGIGRKARREMSNRRNLWHAYVEELEEKHKVPYDLPREIRQRVMYERLLEVVKNDRDIENLQESIARVDERFRLVSIPAEFLWEERMQSIYGDKPYWFLYRALIEFNDF